MAGSDREVNLIIRAKNEASKAIDSVSEALGQLIGVQESVGQSAGKTDGLLGDLSKALGDLGREAQALGALSTVSKNLDRASDSVQRLEGQAKAAGEAAAPLVERYEQAAAATAQLTERAEQAKAALEQQTAALEETRAQSTALAAGVKQAESAYRGIYTALKAAKEPSEELKESYRDQLRGLLQLYDAQERGRAVYGQQKEAVAGARAETADLDKQVRAASAAQEKLGLESGKATEQVSRAEASLAKAREELSAISDMAQKASGALGGVEVSQQAVGRAAAQTAENLDKVRGALARQQSISPETGTAAPASGPAASATSAYRAQIQATADAKKAFDDAREAATSLGASLARTAQPTKQLETDFLLAKQAAAEAEAAYHSNATALNELRGVTQGSVGAFLRLAQTREQERAASMAAAQALNVPPIAPRVEQNTISLRAMLVELLKIPAAAGEAGEQVRRFGEGAGEGSGLVNRMKSEIVGLATAYVGFYGVIQQVSGVIKTVRDLEAAQSRLGVVFEGDQRAAGAEIQFVMDQAKRLGIEFNSLSGEYTKVAIAAKEANFSTAATRQIFLAFAEASRVAGLSTTDMESAFLGLRESIERGTLNARNFNIEIGSRVPGAMQAMAAAIGVTVPKFTELQKSGNSVAANQEVLVKFAENLRQRYGAELPDAVQTLNAEIGRFQTTFEQFQLSVAKGGFSDALKTTLKSLDDFFASTQGQEFVERLARAFGQLTGVLPAVIQNFGLIGDAVKLFVSVKAAEWMVGLVAEGGALSVALKTASVDVDRLSASLGALNAERIGVAFATLRTNIMAARGAMASLTLETAAETGVTVVLDGALAALRGVMVGVAAVARAMWAAVGGVPGLLITAFTFIVSGLLGDWITGVDKATAALDAHAKLVDKVREGYEQVGGSVDGVAAKLKSLSLADILYDTSKLQKSFDDLKTQIAGKAYDRAGGFAGQDPTTSVSKINAAAQALRQGRITAEEFRTEIAKIANADPHLSRGFVDDLRGMADKLADTQKGLDQNAAIMRVLKGTATDADRALLGMAQSVKATSAAFDPSQIEAYTKALREMQRELPGMAKSAEAAAKVQSLDDAMKSGMMALQPALNSSDPKAKAQAQAQQAQLQAAHDAAVAHLTGTATLDESMTGSSGAALMSTARRYQGQNETSNRGSLESFFKEATGQAVDPKITAWCAAFVNAVLATNKLPTTNSLSARSFLNYGSEVSPDKAEPGDIVILKGVGGPGSGHVGFLDGINANGSVRVLGGNQGRVGGGQVSEESFPARDVVGIRRAPGGAEVYKQQAKSDDAVDAFNAFVAQLIADKQKNASATEVSPREAAIQAALKEVDDRIAKSGPTAENPNSPQLSISDADRQRIRDAAGAEFDARQNQATQKKIEQLLEELAEKNKKSPLDSTADEIAKRRQDFISTSAKRDDVNLSSAAGQRYGGLQGQVFDQQMSQDLFSGVMGLNDQKKELFSQLKEAENEGDATKVNALKAQLADIIAKLQQAVPIAKQFATAIGDQRMLGQLDQIKTKVESVQVEITNAKSVNDMFVNGFMGGFDRATEAVASGVNGVRRWGAAWRDTGNAFMGFASDFLKQIAEMILKAELLQAIQKTGWGKGLADGLNSLMSTGSSATGLSAAGGTLNAAAQAWNVTVVALQNAADTLLSASGASGAGGAGGLFSALGISGATGSAAGAGSLADVAGLFHAGGEIGAAGGMSRPIPRIDWSTVTKMHTGGTVGFAPDEIPIVAKRGERVLTQSQARDWAAAQSFQDPSMLPSSGSIKIVNLSNPADLLKHALADEAGQRVLVNHVRQNKTALNSALGNR